MAHQEGIVDARGMAMKTSLWIIIVIIVGFISFLLGYSRPHPVTSCAAAQWSQQSQ